MWWGIGQHAQDRHAQPNSGDPARFLGHSPTGKKDAKMIINIPEGFREYIQILLSKKYAKNQSLVIQKLAEHGLIQTLIAFSQNALGNSEEHVDFLKNCETFPVEISDEFAGVSKIESLSKVLNISQSLCVTILVEVGLTTGGYYFLRHDVEDYKNDRDFRALVDGMPHDSDFEQKEKVTKKTLIIEKNGELEVHNAH